MRVKYRGEWFEFPESLTLGEAAFCEGKLGVSMDEWQNATQMLALTYAAVRRVLPKTQWDEVASYDLMEWDVEADEPAVEVADPKGDEADDTEPAPGS